MKMLYIRKNFAQMIRKIFLFPIIMFVIGFQISISGSVVFAQTLEFNKKVHNFGKIAIKDGAQNCTFEFKNTLNKPVVINNILSSCGCTTPQWPKKPIMPGENGVIKVTFLNDQGPFPFDKSLTVYTSASKKPIILRITGVAYETKKGINEQFPTAIGVLGLKSNILKMGQLEQGEIKSKNVIVVNTSNKPVTVKFLDLSPGLNMKITQQPIPANGLAEITYTIDTKTKLNWGNTIYKARVLCNGTKASKQLLVNCMIIDNFSNLSKDEQNNGPMIIAKNSSYNFGTVSKSTKITATFNLRNTGYRDLAIYKADTNNSKIDISCPLTVKAGNAFTVVATINPAYYNGEQIFTITLVTNSPNRPLVNLFITGTIK